MGSSSQKQTTSQQTGPWAPAQGAIADMIPQVQDMGSLMAGWQPYGSYTGPAVAGFTDPQTAGLSFGTGVATSGGGAVPTANDFLKYQLSGNLLSAGNPYFAGMENSVAQSVLPQLDYQWSKSGRFDGNEEAPQAIAKGLSAAIQPIAYGNYTSELGNMTTAAQEAPTLDMAQYIDPNALLSYGGMEQQQNQAGINDQIYRALYGQTQPENALATELGQLESIGGMGSTSNGTTTTTASPSLLQDIMGGGSMFGGLFGSKGPFGGGGAFSGMGLGSMMGMLPFF